MSYEPRLLGLYGKVFAFVFFAQTSLLCRSVCTKTSGKYFPVLTSRSVNKPLVVSERQWRETYFIC